jgi:hypothetical protein
MKGNRFNPAVPFLWTSKMLDGIREQGERVTTVSLCVCLALNCSYRINKSDKGIPITHKLLKDFCLERHTTYKTLTILEKAGLLVLHRKKGASLRIDLLFLPVNPTKANSSNS